ncbi:uncharacterized protein LOC131631280 [Vicia villosa]|uniref:uncharacterized protein LOC131631280 n=1 Tax=Vicia villosa TaxID=3911 RepID=UPI00273ADCE9|nr:uncharacterized protein LOC131631280 [Vicia villosa]
MVHPNVVLKSIVCTGAKMVEIKFDVGKQFINERKFIFRYYMLQWFCTEDAKLRFDIVIRRSDNGLDRRNEFVTLRCERCDKYTNHIRKLKRDDIGSWKYECPFKLRGYLMANNTWTFNVICALLRKCPGKVMGGSEYSAFHHEHMIVVINYIARYISH